MKITIALWLNKVVLQAPLLSTNFKFAFYKRTKQFQKSNGFRGV